MPKKVLFLLIFLLFLLTFITIFYSKQGQTMTYQVHDLKQLTNLFPKTPQQIEFYKNRCIEDINKQIKKILETPDENRNFENTAKALDKINYFLQPVTSSLNALELISPDEQIRQEAHKALIELTNYFVENVTTNINLYKAFKSYVENNSEKENLTDEDKFFLNETMDDFRQSGLDLPTQDLEKVRKLSKEITELSMLFQTNVAQSNCNIAVTLNDLKGLSQEFINSLKKNEKGDYTLGCDTPTYVNVMENCAVESTRKNLYFAYSNRAYPSNMDVLNEIINKRDDLAKLIGFKDYNHLILDKEMVKNPEKAYSFLNSLKDKASAKIKDELKNWKSDLPDSVTLSKDNKIKPWDIKFLKNYYKKKYLDIDEQKISEYFPVEHTVKELLNIYEKFLSIKFKEITGVQGDFWHDDVKLIEAYNNDNKLLGYLLLDLYPRENKYSHAACTTIISCANIDNKFIPSVNIVIANFPKSIDNQPSLLKYRDVKTFFHEFGHAIHAMLGCSNFYSFSGTKVKKDFVEMPSQMLEDWLKDKEILKKVSKHYKTEESLPEELINKIIDIEKFDSGEFILNQIYYALLSLDYYATGKNKNIQEISENLYKQILNHMQWNDQNHFQASFIHLPDYGPRYYGYLWSKVFAKDLFNEIKKYGLLNPEIGQKYIKEVIGKGGSKDPNDLLRNFLGRDPNEKAFFNDLGLSH